MAPSSSWSEAGKGNRNSMMRRTRRKLGPLSSPLDAAETSATSGSLSSQRVAKEGAMHKKGTLFSLSEELLAECPGVLHSKWH